MDVQQAIVHLQESKHVSTIPIHDSNRLTFVQTNSSSPCGLVTSMFVA